MKKIGDVYVIACKNWNSTEETDAVMGSDCEAQSRSLFGPYVNPTLFCCPMTRSR
jgi:hypothetical protein